MHASEIFGDDDCGLILETKDFATSPRAHYPTSGIPEVGKLLHFQDGEATPVSDLMGRDNHVFVVVPKADVSEELDWRLPGVEAGKCLVAFDGAALLLRELWRQRPVLGRRKGDEG